ncbi:MAG TPA: HAMP domain-containing sensor histidine kinase [Egicoccus sp.]|nr:HAMP domain-containing sensor histidine kinase [Egicoccus sp.]HSK24402.1 HAMP domain-containing sensor histidine kinase [Egicoccus sp.]
MSAPTGGRRLLRRLFLGQVSIVVIGAATLGIVAFLVAPPIFNDHVHRAVGPMSDVVAHHLDQALIETLRRSLVIGVGVSALAGAGVAWWLATRVARPVEELSATAHALASGHLDARTPTPSSDDEITDLAVAFNTMAEALDATERTRRRLLSDLAHELRTPLATLEGYHEGLVDGVVEPGPETWATLQDATTRLRRLVEDLTLVSRADEGRLEMDLARVDLAELAADSVESLARQAQDQDVAVTVTPPDIPAYVYGDRDRLGQVLTNLLTNALAHTSAGGRIEVAVRTDHDEVVVEVRDDGAGIAPEHLPHLFDRFYRADPSRRRGRGSGIGLTISRAIAHAHGGDIEASSAGPGRGATFVLRLPAAPAV